MIAPSLGPMPSPFAMPGFSGTISTAPIKGAQAQISMMQHKQPRQKFVWNLDMVPTLPEFHPLERTAVFVPYTTPSIVAQRVSDTLRERSIEATYEDEKGKAKCVTTDGVDFRVRLYQGRNKYSHGIIVEVQRRFGASIHFHNDTQAILDSAEGKIPEPPPTRMNSNNNALPLVSDEEDDYSTATSTSTASTPATAPTPSGASSLIMVSKMLALPGYDAQYLGMQTLSSLVDAAKMSPATARAVSTELLKPNSQVGAKVFKYIVNRNSTNNNQDDSSSLLGLRVMAMGILANSIKATSAGTVPEFVREPLRPVLLQDLRQAEAHPRTAYMAAKCMEHFVNGDYDTMELNQAFEAALEVGNAKHKDLMKQAERCIAKIR
jgi:hypothetical protein